MREGLCNIVREFRVLMKLVRLLEMCLNETYINIRIDKHLSGSVSIQNGLELGDF
jgi:hypothetical protein